MADPAATAEHLSDQTMAVYDALGVLDGLVLDLRDGLGVKAGIYDCHGRGLAHVLDNLEEAPLRMSPARRRSARASLSPDSHTRRQQSDGASPPSPDRAGMDSQLPRAARQHIQLKLTPPSTGPGGVSDTVFVDFYDPSGFLTIEAHAECARYLDDTCVDIEGKPEHLAYLSVPARVRRE